MLTENLNEQTEISPERISMPVFVTAYMRKFVDESKYQDIVAVVLLLAIPQAHVYIFFVGCIRGLVCWRVYVLL